MLDKIKDSYEKIMSSKEFKAGGFLCGAFIICDIDQLETTNWQIDFYEKEKNLIQTYIVSEKIEKTNESEVFKTEDMTVEELDLKEIKRDFKDLTETIKEILDKNKEEPVKITIILQKQKVPIWNIIYITKKFNLLNIKINAISGELIEEKLVNLLSFEKGDRSTK